MKRLKAPPEIQIVPSLEELALAAALHFVYRAKAAIEEKNLFTVALSCDSVLDGAYSRLTDDPALRMQLSWDSVHCFSTDARHTGANEAPNRDRGDCAGMLEKFPLPPSNRHRIKVEYSIARRAASDYERQLRKFFALKPRQLPRFDLVLLSMGADGQVASLYRGSEALQERERLVTAHRLDGNDGYGITMTVPVLNNAAGIIFLISGEDKAGIVREVLAGEHRPPHYPAQAVQTRNRKTLWLMDKTAAQLLEDYLRIS
ncbi:MAG TPA: 6-phosphogluconolactonase [Bryobacteraceae bacterium]